MSIASVSFITGLFTKLEALGGEIDYENFNYDGSFVVSVYHPDVTINRRTGDDTVQIRCRRGMFPPTRAHVDVDDIMTVIEGWMKEAGGKCGASKAELPCEKCGHSSYEHDMTGCLVAPCECHERGPRYGTVGMTREKAYQKGYERRPEELRAELLAKKRREWGVDRQTGREEMRSSYEADLEAFENERETMKKAGFEAYGNYRLAVGKGNGAQGVITRFTNTLQNAKALVAQWKLLPAATHIELEDTRPGGRIWYYDRDRSGFWKRTVHN